METEHPDERAERPSAPLPRVDVDAYNGSTRIRVRMAGETWWFTGEVYEAERWAHLLGLAATSAAAACRAQSGEAEHQRLATALQAAERENARLRAILGWYAQGADGRLARQALAPSAVEEA